MGTATAATDEHQPTWQGFVQALSQTLRQSLGIVERLVGAEYRERQAVHRDRSNAARLGDADDLDDLCTCG
jgi:hypothetical protein